MTIVFDIHIYFVNILHVCKSVIIMVLYVTTWKYKTSFFGKFANVKEAHVNLSTFYNKVNSFDYVSIKEQNIC